MRNTKIIAVALLVASAAAAQTKYSNGPFVTAIGAGFGGADVSVMDPLHTAFGVNGNWNGFISVADDFTVPCGEVWTVSAFRGFGYQTGSTTVSTMNAAGYAIWNGRPGEPGSVVIHNYMNTSQFTSTAFTNTYRVAAGASLLGNTRPIMSVNMAANAIVLSPGKYWFEYGIAGTLASGPFIPTVTIVGSPITGDGMQYLPQTTTTGLWTGPVLNNTSASGIPFEIDYTITNAPCYSFTLSQPGVGGAVTFANAGGAPGAVYINALTAIPGMYPNGWFAGLDIGLNEFVTEIALGAPFFGVLDGSGAATLVIPGPIPSGITFYAASIQYGPAELGRQSAFVFTTL